MALQFPTMAEQCLKEWQERDRTISLVRIAEAHGAEVSNLGKARTYTFDDDTFLEVTGRGPQHRVESFLP